VTPARNVMGFRSEREIERARAFPRQGYAARLALFRLLVRACHAVPLPTIGAWTREEQGAAYLWAYAFTSGREDLPPPRHVAEASS
jgi:hypothetical protein